MCKLTRHYLTCRNYHKANATRVGASGVKIQNFHLNDNYIDLGQHIENNNKSLDRFTFTSKIYS